MTELNRLLGLPQLQVRIFPAQPLFMTRFKFLKLSAECIMDCIMTEKEKRFCETSKFQT